MNAASLQTKMEEIILIGIFLDKILERFQNNENKFWNDSKWIQEIKNLQEIISIDSSFKSIKERIQEKEVT